MTLRNVSLVSLMFTVGLAGACGGSTVDAQVQPSEDAGTAAPVADSAPPDDPVSSTYPSAHAAIPLVDFNGGKIMTAPKIVTITFDGDPLRDRLESFGDVITATPWWDAVSAGYCDQGGSPCIGRGTAGEHVHLPASAASSYTDSSQGKPSTIQDFIRAQVAAGTFPAPTVNTLYAIYFPDGVSINLDDSLSCSAFGAYHNTLSLATPVVGDAGTADGGDAQVVTPYAIMPRCSTSEAEATVAASHEFIEAATDPDIGVNDIAFYMNNQLWAFAGGEVGDVCVDFTGSGADLYKESGFTVQRSWSNKAARASHDPCVPAIAGEPYYNVAPKAGSEQITLTKIGDSKTIVLDAFSDGPLANWTVSAIDFAKFQGGTSNVSFAFDKTSVNNGSHVNLTITLKSKPQSGYVQYAIVSKSNGKQTRDWPGVVLTQ